jgi:hypothetical protein
MILNHFEVLGQPTHERSRLEINIDQHQRLVELFAKLNRKPIY